MTEKTRTKDGVEEHCHGDYDYWHPVARVHPWFSNKVSIHTKHVYDVDEDGVNEIIAAMADKQSRFSDMYGETHTIDVLSDIAEFDTLSPDWAIAISKIPYLETQVTYLYGGVAKVRVSSSRDGVEFIHGHAQYVRGSPHHNGVEFTYGRAQYDTGSDIHAAKILVETGIASHYISDPDLPDAMHIMHVSGGDRYNDLIRLPSGGHVPVDILEEEYGVSWETIARIPRGKQRDQETFSCPLCGAKSYFAGVCSYCKDFYANCMRWDLVEQADRTRAARKEQEHGEIRRLIKSGNWKQCRYMMG